LTQVKLTAFAASPQAVQYVSECNSASIFNVAVLPSPGFCIRMYPMDRRIDWIMQKGALAVALYFAIAAGVGWLQYGIAAGVWSMLALTLWTVPAAAGRRSVLAAVPPVATTAFDLAVLAALFLAHWYWTAFAFAAWCGCVAITQARRTS
jgi:hypothetical protein